MPTHCPIRLMHLCKVCGLVLLSCSLLCCLTTQQQITGVPQQVDSQDHEGFLATWTSDWHDEWNANSGGWWCVGSDDDKPMSLVFWSEERKSHNNRNITDWGIENLGIKNNDDYIIMNNEQIQIYLDLHLVFWWECLNHHPTNCTTKHWTQKRLYLITFCGDMNSLEYDKTLQGILANLWKKRLCYKSIHGRHWQGSKVKFFTKQDLEYDGKMSLKVKKENNYKWQDWKEYWDMVEVQCVRAALHEKRNSMVANVQKAALIRK